MADSKITALASISTSTDPAVDPLVIVDVSDTSMAATGTTKKVTLNNLLSSSPTATGAFTVSGLVTAGSATITGDLTVDTNVLKVDSTNNRVGIGTASPSQKLTVSGTDTSTAIFTSSGAATAVTIDNTHANAWGGNLAIATGSVNAGYFGTIGSLLGTTSQNLAIWATSGNGIVLHTNNSGTAKTIIDTNGVLLVGVTSANANGGVLQLKSGITFPATQVAASDANTLDDYEEGTFTPTIGASSGTATTVTINSAIYTKIGREVTVIFDFSIVAVGTAAGAFQFSLPFNQSASSVSCGAFRENGTTGNMGQVFYNTAADVSCFLYNNATVWNNGYRLRGTYTYSV